jgi:hypothetical protein
MTNCILRVSGTFGSGKTTVVREFLTAYPSQALHRSGQTKVMGYEVRVPRLGAVFVIGSYHNTCGGCDGIPTQEEIVERILKAAPLGHVIYEGALISASGLAGAVTRAVHPVGGDVYAFLDTPLDLCIERVKIRRVRAGNTKSFDPKNLIQKFNSVANCRKNLLAEGTYDIRVLDHTNPHPQMLEILTEFENA